MSDSLGPESDSRLRPVSDLGFGLVRDLELEPVSDSGLEPGTTPD